MIHRVRQQAAMGDLVEGAGAIATGALIAREVERARGDAPAVGHAVDEPCANCGTVRQGPYCHSCGQAGHVHRSLGALAHDIAHGVFHFEGKMWHTMPLLAWRPGELTRRYVHGERARFVSPMALFLFSVFLMFAVVSNLAGHGSHPPLGPRLQQQLAQARVNNDRHLAELGARRAAATSPKTRARLDGEIADLKGEMTRMAQLTTVTPDHDDGIRVDVGAARSGIPRWLQGSIGHAVENPDLLLYKMKSNGYKFSWALIPISLPFIWLLFFWRRDLTLYDHAIFSIYSLSFMSLAVVALTVLGKVGVPTAMIALAAMFVPPLHMYRQLKGAYALGRFGALWRTAALLVITSIVSVLFLAFLFYLGSD